MDLCYIKLHSQKAVHVCVYAHVRMYVYVWMYVHTYYAAHEHYHVHILSCSSGTNVRNPLYPLTEPPLLTIRYDPSSIISQGLPNAVTRS